MFSMLYFLFNQPYLKNFWNYQNNWTQTKIILKLIWTSTSLTKQLNFWKPSFKLPVTPSERHLERSQKVPGRLHEPGRPETFWFLSRCLSEGVAKSGKRVLRTQVAWIVTYPAVIFKTCSIDYKCQDIYVPDISNLKYTYHITPDKHNFIYQSWFNF
jgi:hypothetical protein